MTTRPVSRHECALRNDSRSGFHHTSGPGRPTRKRCAHCGGALLTLTGWHGVFTWTGTGRYPADAAASLHRSESAAQAVVDADTTGTLVVRWVTS